MRVTLCLALAAALVLPAMALGHGTDVHARGTIKEIAADHVVLAGDTGEQSFAISSETHVVRGAKTERIADVRAGERAVVHARRDGEKLHAKEVRLAPTESGAGKGKERTR